MGIISVEGVRWMGDPTVNTVSIPKSLSPTVVAPARSLVEETMEFVKPQQNSEFYKSSPNPSVLLTTTSDTKAAQGANQDSPIAAGSTVPATRTNATPGKINDSSTDKGSKGETKLNNREVKESRGVSFDDWSAYLPNYRPYLQIGPYMSPIPDGIASSAVTTIAVDAKDKATQETDPGKVLGELYFDKGLDSGKHSNLSDYQAALKSDKISEEAKVKIRKSLEENLGVKIDDNLTEAEFKKQVERFQHANWSLELGGSKGNGFTRHVSGEVNKKTFFAIFNGTEGLQEFFKGKKVDPAKVVLIPATGVKSATQTEPLISVAEATFREKVLAAIPVGQKTGANEDKFNAYWEDFLKWNSETMVGKDGSGENKVILIPNNQTEDGYVQKCVQMYAEHREYRNQYGDEPKKAGVNAGNAQTNEKPIYNSAKRTGNSGYFSSSSSRASVGYRAGGTNAYAGTGSLLTQAEVGSLGGVDDVSKKIISNATNWWSQDGGNYTLSKNDCYDFAHFALRGKRVASDTNAKHETSVKLNRSFGVNQLSALIQSDPKSFVGSLIVTSGCSMFGGKDHWGTIVNTKDGIRVLHFYSSGKVGYSTLEEFMRKAGDGNTIRFLSEKTDANPNGDSQIKNIENYFNNPQLRETKMQEYYANTFKDSSRLYDELKLAEKGCSREAFDEAIKRYNTNSQINKRFLSIVDYSKKATEDRMFVIDFVNKKVYATQCAHGKNSGDIGGAVTNTVGFNSEGSHMTGSGAYMVGANYDGKHGFSVRVKGLDASNANAESKDVVIHTADYVKDGGRSFGCFAVPPEDIAILSMLANSNSMLYSYVPVDARRR